MAGSKRTGDSGSDRIVYNLTQQYRETTTEFGSGGLEEDADGLFSIPVEGAGLLFAYNHGLGPGPRDRGC